MFGNKKSSPRVDTAGNDIAAERHDPSTPVEQARPTPAGAPAYQEPDEPIRAGGQESRPAEVVTPREQLQRRRVEFGGLKAPAVFYGWLVAVGLTTLLVGIVGAVAAATDSSLDVSTADAKLKAGTIGLSGAIALSVILIVAYFGGGYVAGRLGRFTGALQGFATWVLGLVVTIIVVLIGAGYGTKYNVFDRINLPSLPIRSDDLTRGAVITFAVILLGTLIFSVLGGMLGQHYHSRIDRRTI